MAELTDRLTPARSRPSGGDMAAGARQIMTNQRDHSPRASHTLSKGLALLSAFRPGELHLGNKEFAERTGFSRPTVSRLAKMLVELGFLRHLGPIGRYALGNAVLTLGHPLAVSLSLWQVARPLMEELAEAVSGQVSLGVRDRFSVVSIESTANPRASAVMPFLGQVWPLLPSAMGRAHLAAMAPAERDRLLGELRTRMPGVWARHGADWPEALAHFRQQGFASSFGCARPRAYACAVPLRLRWNEEIVALNCSIAAPASLGPEAFTARVGPRLLRAAFAIEAAVESVLEPDGPVPERELSRIPLSSRALRPSS